MSIFDDLAGLPDDAEITIGEKSFKLGDIKTEYTQERTQREALAGERDGWRSKHDKLSDSVATLLGQAGKAADADSTPPVDPRQGLWDRLERAVKGDDPVDALYADPLFGKALTRAEERAYERAEKENKRLSDAFETLKTEVTNGLNGLANASVYTQDAIWYGDNKSDIPKGQDGKKVTLKQMQDFADNNNLFHPGTRIRNLDRALEVLTAPTRRQAEISAAEQAAYQKGMNDARANAGKVIPLMSERNGGGMPKGQEYTTAGKSARQIVSERLQQGLADLSAEEAG